MMNVRNANHESFKPPHSQLGLVPVDSDPLLHAPPSSCPSRMSAKDGCAFFVAAERRAVQNMYLKERKDLAEKGKVSASIFPCEWCWISALSSLALFIHSQSQVQKTYCTAKQMMTAARREAKIITVLEKRSSGQNPTTLQNTRSPFAARFVLPASAPSCAAVPFVVTNCDECTVVFADALRCR